MTRTRWKIMAGGLAISLGGLATMAGAQTACQKTDQKSAPLPVVPAPVEIPALPLPSGPAVPTPLVATPGDVVVPVLAAPIIPASAKAAVAGGTVEVAPRPREVMTATVTELTLPVTIEPALVPPPAKRDPLLTPESAKSTQPVTERVWAGGSGSVNIPPGNSVALAPLPAPAPNTPVALKPEPVAPVAKTDPVPLPPPPADAPPPAPAHTQQRVADPVPPAPVQRPAAAMPAERKLKVVLNMGDERPRFEVRDGEEVYLKVVCDKIDVKTTPEVGANMATMRATGHVAFVTPGGEGFCDELSVVPGAGQVVVSGKVSFKYNWGKAETVVSGERMTFRLGTAPGMAPASPATVPASYQRR
jgi:hypothetical protein